MRSAFKIEEMLIVECKCELGTNFSVLKFVIIKACSCNVSAVKFKVCKSVHRHTFHINQPTRCNNFSSFLLDVYSYVQLNMFRASPRPSSAMKQRGERSSVLILLPKPGAEAKNEDPSNTRIHSTRHWARKNQILPTQI